MSRLYVANKYEVEYRTSFDMNISPQILEDLIQTFCVNIYSTDVHIEIPIDDFMDFIEFIEYNKDVIISEYPQLDDNYDLLVNEFKKLSKNGDTKCGYYHFEFM